MTRIRGFGTNAGLASVLAVYMDGHVRKQFARFLAAQIIGALFRVVTSRRPKSRICHDLESLDELGTSGGKLLDAVPEQPIQIILTVLIFL